MVRFAFLWQWAVRWAFVTLFRAITRVLVMANLRLGQQAALLIVDVQVGVVRDAWQTARVVATLADAVTRARAAGVPVIWIQHADDELPKGSADWAWVPELVPAPGEVLIHKQYNSGFEATELEAVLAERDISHLLLGGASSNWCIRATAYAALERGYDLTLLSDAHTNGGCELENGRRIDGGDIAAELNKAMTWLSYPGRRNRALPAGTLDFADLATLA